MEGEPKFPLLQPHCNPWYHCGEFFTGKLVLLKKLWYVVLYVVVSNNVNVILAFIASCISTKSYWFPSSVLRD